MKKLKVKSKQTKKNCKWLKIVLIILPILLIGFLVYVIYNMKVEMKVLEEKAHIYVINEKLSEDMMTYYDSSVDSASLKNIAASEYSTCMKSKLSNDELSEEINNAINELKKVFNSSKNNFSFKYQDIYTGFTISYNEKQFIFGASTIKAPACIYLYEMASQGKINLDDKLTYTRKYRDSGSGILKNTKYNISYTVRDLIKYSIYYSDNAAYNMLVDKYGRVNMYNFWKAKGTTAIFKNDTHWGYTNAHDASIFMGELYKFYLENDEFGNELMDDFLNAEFKLLKGSTDDIKVANKAGWNGSTIHDTGIVFDKNPYTLVVFTNLYRTNKYNSLFDTVNKKISYIHSEYWKLKVDKCSKILQY